MSIELILETPDVIAGPYATVSIAFRVDRVLELTLPGGDLGGFELQEVPVSPAYTKNYDVLPGADPREIVTRWPMTNWQVIAAFEDGVRVGGAIVCYSTPGLHILEDRTDLGALWDLRVAEDRRGQGIGKRLFEAAVEWMRARGCRTLKVETQNTNVAACRFYESRGCTLGTIGRFAYSPELDEVQLVWYLDI